MVAIKRWNPIYVLNSSMYGDVFQTYHLIAQLSQGYWLQVLLY